MGVKVHYKYSTEDGAYINMQAYRQLIGVHGRMVSRGMVDKKWTTLPGGWRKNIEPLYKVCKEKWGTRLGTLERFKTSSIYSKDKLFKSRRSTFLATRRAKLAKEKPKKAKEEPRRMTLDEALHQAAREAAERTVARLG